MYPSVEKFGEEQDGMLRAGVTMSNYMQKSERKNNEQVKSYATSLQR